MIPSNAHSSIVGLELSRRGFVNSQKRPFFDPYGGRKTEKSPKLFVAATTIHFRLLSTQADALH